jgi:hypothetical protein
MPRIIVTTELRPDQEPAVLLNERVHSVHLSTGHAAAQLVERLAWAIVDAEQAETEPPASTRKQTPARPTALSLRRAQPLAA